MYSAFPDQRKRNFGDFYYADKTYSRVILAKL